MEKLYKLVDQMEAAHMKQDASIQQCIAVIYNIQHN